MARKKKRSAAQLAATKKLVALNKKRRKKKTVVKRKTRAVVKRKKKTVKKVIKRKSNPTVSAYYIVKVDRNNKMVKGNAYFDGSGWTTKSKAASWGDRYGVNRTANLLSGRVNFGIAIYKDESKKK